MCTGWFSLFLILALAGAGTAQAAELQLIAGRTMGTTFVVKLATDQPPPAGGFGAVIDRLLQDTNEKMSTYLPDSELSRFNRQPTPGWFPASAELIEVMQEAHRVSRRSHGAFDITVAPLVDLWGFGPRRTKQEVPPAPAICEALKLVGYDRISTRHQPAAIRKECAGIACDLSGIAKGYGVDRIARYLETAGVKNFLIEIGGEVRARGTNDHGHIWSVGIQHPQSSKALHRVVGLRDRALATSGDYVQAFEQDGRRYSHTIDPRTGRPVTHNLASVTVIHASCTLADAWATALNVLGPEAGHELALREKLAVLMLLRAEDGLTERVTPQFTALTAAPHP